MKWKMNDELPLHVIFLRHGRTTDNDNGVISGGMADPGLTLAGREQAKQAHTVYTILRTQGIINDTTVLFTTDRRRAVDTAKLFTGRVNGEYFITDPRLLERRLGDWDCILTERFQKEIKRIPNFSPPNEEISADHKAHVFDCLDERIAEACGQPIIIVSHGGTTRRIAAYFGIEEGLEVENAVPHHAVSNDGGTNWTVRKFRVDDAGILQEEFLPKKIAKVATAKRTMESILLEYRSRITLSSNDQTHTLTIVNVDSTIINTLAHDLGQLLIGNKYDPNTVVVDEGSVIVAQLTKRQGEILHQFAKLKGIDLAA